MNVQTISMDRTEARKAFLEYRKAVRARHTAEDQAIMAGYKAIARGISVVNVRESIKGAGLNSKLLPLLAIARADALKVYYSCNEWRGAVFTTKVHRNRYVDWEARAGQSFSFAKGDLPEVEGDHSAFLPYIPKPLRPVGDLSRYHVLWEATWLPEPPRDPMLLRRLHGDLFAVVAHWNLTDLERAVMAGRIR